MTLSLSSVSLSYGDVDVLDDISLSVRDGEFLGLVGPNGAGKTTLLQTVNGVLDPDEGQVTVDGQDVGDLSARERARLVATVPQDTSVRFDLSVRDLVETGRTPYRGRLQFGASETDRRQVREAIERTELAELADRSVGAISGGERQRAYVARALAQDAPLICCDEPTASLDVNHQVRVLELLSALADEGRTVVAAIHDLDLAARYCDRLALLSGGHVAASGTPESVLTGGAIDAAFETTTTVATNPVTGSPTVTAHERSDADREATVHVVGGGRVGARAIATLIEAGFSVTAGPLRDGDLAVETTRTLGVETALLAPTGRVDPETRQQARSSAAEADIVVLADVAVGPDAVALSVGEAADRLVVVEQRPLHERNHGGEAVSERYEQLRSSATTVDPEGLLEGVEERLGAQPADRSTSVRHDAGD